MARYFWGNTLASFGRSTAAVVDGDTTSGRFDSTFVASCLKVPAGLFLKTQPFVDAASTTTLWTHFDGYLTPAGLIGNGTVVAEWLNSSGVVVLRLTGNSNSVNTSTLSYWNGSTYVNLLTNIVVPINTLTRFDFKVTAGVSGTFDMYTGGTVIHSGSGMNAAVTNFAEMRLYGVGSGGSFLSQLMGADFDTRDSRYYQQVPAALGTLTDGTGAVGTINETVLDESTSVSLPTSTNKRSFTHPTFTLPSGYSIGAVCANARARINGSGPSDGKLGIYDITAATSYLSSALSLNSGYEPRGAYWATDPNTAADWTAAGWNDAEVILAAA